MPQCSHTYSNVIEVQDGNEPDVRMSLRQSVTIREMTFAPEETELGSEEPQALAL